MRALGWGRSRLGLSLLLAVGLLGCPRKEDSTGTPQEAAAPRPAQPPPPPPPPPAPSTTLSTIVKLNPSLAVVQTNKTLPGTAARVSVNSTGQIFVLTAERTVLFLDQTLKVQNSIALAGPGAGTALIATDNGPIYVGTGGTLIQLNLGLNVVSVVGNPVTLGGTITGIAVSPAGVFAVSSSGTGGVLHKRTPALGTGTPASVPLTEVPTAVEVNAAGNILVTTTNGKVFQFNSGLNPLPTASILVGGTPIAVAADLSNPVVVGRTDGLTRINPTAVLAPFVAFPNLVGVDRDDNGLLVALSSTGQLGKFSLGLGGSPPVASTLTTGTAIAVKAASVYVIGDPVAQPVNCATNPPVCGDSCLQSSEQCDPPGSTVTLSCSGGNQSGRCLMGCRLPACTTGGTGGSGGGNPCDPGQTRCGNACVNTSTDKQNCNGCGNKCAEGQECFASACTNCNCTECGVTVCGKDCGCPAVAFPTACDTNPPATHPFQCRACGSKVGQVCCDGLTCEKTLACDPPTNKCVPIPCGGVGQPCCKGLKPCRTTEPRCWGDGRCHDKPTCEEDCIHTHIECMFMCTIIKGDYFCERRCHMANAACLKLCP